MRDIEEQRIALECLNLANNYDLSPEEIVKAAGQYYSFVSGEAQSGIEVAVIGTAIPNKFADELADAIRRAAGKFRRDLD